MRLSCISLALIALALPATASGPAVVSAINAERDSAFVDRADCEKALGGVAVQAGATELAGQRGSLFNRAAGNLSRCELVEGEYSIVVYPKGSPAPAAD